MKTTKLKTYLDSMSIKYTGFGRRIGIGAASMLYIVNGDRLPTLKQALKIDKHTAGYVTPYDWDVDL